MIKSGNPVHICFISDNNYIVPTCTAIQSLVESKRADTQYVIHIVCASLSAESEHFFEAFKSDTVELSVIRADANQYSDYHVYREDIKVVATVSALLKFALPELLPALDKVLYLDGDLIVREDLSSLYQTELSTNMVAAAPDSDPFFKRRPVNDSVQIYFNSGVMLLNLRQMRLENATEQLLQAKKEKTDGTLMDQDAFNIVFDGRVVKLPIWYNFISIIFYNARGRWTINSINERYELNCGSVEELFHSWKILHFATKEKPWRNPEVVFAEVWYDAYRKSPVYGIDSSINDVCRSTVCFANPSDAVVPEGFDRVIPVVFACNEKFASYAGVAIQSVLENAGAGNFYRVYVLHSGLSDESIRLLEAHSTQQLSVRCLNVDLLIQSKVVQLYERGHFSKEMYYRFLIPELLAFYPRAIYLDCDLVVTRDIADILPPEMGDNLLAVVRNKRIKKERERLSTYLHVNPDNYFHSGNIVINISQWNSEKIGEKCFNSLTTTPYEQLICPDQDILNIICQDRVLFLDDKWCFAWHMVYGSSAEYVALNKPLVDRIGNDFYLLHFASNLKPWDHPELPLSMYFWKHAANSVFYQRILQNLAENGVAANKFKKEAARQKAETDSLKKELARQNVETDKLKKELARQKVETDKLKKQNAQLKYDLDRVHASVSFRVGRAITFIPRKLRGGVQCYKDNGPGYTFRRALYHMGLWKDEEKE